MSGTTQEGDLVVMAVPGLWLEGTTGDDNLAGGDGNDTLLGGAGDDALNGGAGDDALSGGTGADLLQGGAGADSLNGGEGDDVLDGEAGDDTLSGGAGNDVLLDFDGASLLYGEAGDDGLFTGAGVDQLYGGEGNDYLSSGEGDDRLSGDAGDDTLSAGDGADVLHGGEGNDTYEGGTGGDVLYDFSVNSADTYLYNLGDGVDTVYDYGGVDAVQLGGGITAATTTVRCNTAGDLVLTFADGGRLTLSSQYGASTGVARSNHQVEQIVFDDGTAWDQAQLRALALASGTAGDDVMQGFDTDDTLAGAGGNDTLSGGDGDDALHGDDGNDRLDGGSGNNQLFGGAGKDSLRGGAGSDRFEGGTGDDFMFDPSATSGDSYHYRLGDGADSVFDLGGADEVRLGAGITPDGTSVRVDGNGSVVLDFADGGNLRLMYQYDMASGAARAEQIEQVRFEDGTVWDPAQLLAQAASQVQALVSAMAAFTPPALGQTQLPADAQAALAPVIATHWT